jgi:predicted nucleic acid-binding protein
VKTTDEGRAAARRAEIRERLLQIAHRESLSDDITEDEFADVCRNIPWTIEETRELVATLREAADLLAECDRLSRAVEALKALLKEPHGCSLCDSWNPRNPAKGHQPDCPYELARAAIGALRV